ncbi:hypothetical protein SPX_03430 [Sporomusa paucivorans]
MNKTEEPSPCMHPCMRRRETAKVTFYTIGMIYHRPPGVIAWWSAAFPGFGYISLCSHLKGYLFIIWEIIINVNSNLNAAIVYAFTGRFDMSIAVVDSRWLLLYCPVYIFNIWCSYRMAVSINKVAQITQNQPLSIKPQAITGIGINILDKRPPYLAIVWSMLMPGLGHVYTTRLTTALVLIGIWTMTVFYSGFLPALHLTLLGQFGQAVLTADPQWLLFLPSIYCFSMYDAYAYCVEYNSLFDREQAQFLRNNYQDAAFEMPL